MTDSPFTDRPDDPGITRLVQRLTTGDPSLALALGALLDVADEQGTAPLHAIATRFREGHLAAIEAEKGDAIGEANRLSLEDVRTHLATALLPRLADVGAIERHDQSRTNPDARIALQSSLWAELRAHRDDVTRLLRITGDDAAQPRTSAAVPEVPATSSVLEASALVKIYRGRRVVNDVALRVAQGEIVGLLGPNGAGKTTTFYMLVGLIAPQAGVIRLDGKDITSMPMYERARHGIGYLSQEPSIFRKLTVEQNILAILETLPLSGTERKARLETLLDELRIKHLRGSRAFQLSGGERRRLEITRALVTEPKFMMLDEPFAGVDPIAVHDIQTIVAGLRHRGIGVLISDHNVEQTLDIVDRAYIMFDGQVKVSGTVRELVFDDTVARIYLGPTLTARLRSRFAEAEEGALTT